MMSIPVLLCRGLGCFSFAQECARNMFAPITFLKIVRKYDVLKVVSTTVSTTM